MEWEQVKLKIIENLVKVEEYGYFSDENMKLGLETDGGEDWENILQLGIKKYINDCIEERRKIEKESEIFTQIRIYAGKKAFNIYSEHCERYIKKGKMSLQTYKSIIENDIELNNAHIRKFIYKDTLSAFPENMEGIDNVATEKCYSKSLLSNEWEDFYHYSIMLFTTILLKFHLCRIQNNMLSILEVIEILENDSNWFHIYLKKIDLEQPLKNDKIVASFQLLISDNFIFESKCSNEQLIGVKNLLVSYNYISPNSDENFLYWFGRTNINNPVKLNWLKINTRKNIDKQAVTELIVRLCGQTNNPAIIQCFGFKAPKNQPSRGQFENKFNSEYNSIVPK